MGMPAHFMGANSRPFFNDARSARSWQVARPSSSSWGNRVAMRLPDHESGSALPREGWILYDGGLRVLLSLGSPLAEGELGGGASRSKILQSAFADGSLHLPQDESAGRHTSNDPRWKIGIGCRTHTFTWPGESGGHGLSTQSSVCRAFIGCSGAGLPMLQSKSIPNLSPLSITPTSPPVGRSESRN